MPPLPPGALRRLIASICGAIACTISAASCSDGPSSLSRAASGTRGRVALAPVFSREAAAVYAQRGSFDEISFDRARVVIVRARTDTVKDTTVAFAPGSPDVTLDLDVEVRGASETFSGVIQYANAATTIFEGRFDRLLAYAPGEPVPQPPPVTIEYVGPGAAARRLVIAPKTATIVAPAGMVFTATAFDDRGNAIQAPVAWTSSDPTVASIGRSTGVLQPTGRRGTVVVTARTPTAITDDATVAITLPAAAITVVSGTGQTAKAGEALIRPMVVRVTAADGVGVSGIPVVFTAPTGGRVGGAATTTITTDGNGAASAALTLGSAAGVQTFSASAGGIIANVAATATSADPESAKIFSGDGQQDTVQRALKAPLVVRVADRFDNPVAGVTVSWTRTAGAGALAGGTSTTSSDGLASMTYTLGATEGVETITAAAAGVAATATFTIRALSPGAASIVATSGNNQSGRVLQPLTAPFVVRVTDRFGNPVSGTTVQWTPANGTIAPTTVTDAQGRTGNTLTLGSAVGPASVVASITTAVGPRSVTFVATAQPGLVARIVFRNAPSNGATGAPLAPPVQLELRDIAGNLTAATNPVSIALGANPAGAVLSGTLTRAALAGVATFDDLTLDRAGVGFTLVASSAGVSSVTSAPFSVTSGAIFIDGFEAAAIDPFWTVVEQSGTVRPSAVQVRAGAQSVAFTSASGARSMRLSHSFATPITGTFSVWMYDAAPGQQTLYAMMTLYNSAIPGRLAVIGTQDFDATCYMARLDIAPNNVVGPNANCGAFPQTSTTNVQRTLGWHLLEIRVGPTGTTFAIDGQAVYTAAGSFLFDRVELSLSGPAFRPNTVVYFDDFIVR